MDRFNVAGLDSACGYASWLGDIKTEHDEGVLVKQLRSLGAVVFCKTNVPMSSMVSYRISYQVNEACTYCLRYLQMGETDNNIMGFTMNPYNRMLSAGGACGGKS